MRIRGEAFLQIQVAKTIFLINWIENIFVNKACKEMNSFVNRN